MNKTLIVAVVLIIVALGGGFYAGMQYQRSQTANRFAQFGNGQGGQFFRRFGQNGQNGINAVRGQVVSTDSNSITIKLSDGSTKILIVGSSTAYMKSAAGSLSDLKTGDTVAVFGTTNSDGYITAQNVQINPPERRPNPTAMPTK